MPVRILGISAYYHDSAACLVEDGRIVAAAQEERFTRIRHDHAFPREAIAYCLKEAGIQAKDLEYVCFYDKPLKKFDRILETYFAYVPAGFMSFKRAIPLWLREKLHTPREIRKGMNGEYQGKLIFSVEGSDGQFVAALDAASGKLVWQTPRQAEADKKFSFHTPLAIEQGGRQVISAGSGVIAARAVGVDVLEVIADAGHAARRHGGLRRRAAIGLVAAVAEDEERVVVA